MQNKVVVIYRNDEVARTAVNNLLEDGFPFDRIYISSDDDIEQVRYYDRIGENRLLPRLENDLGRFYRSIEDMDNVPETTGLYTRALRDGYVIVSVDTDSYRDAMKAAKTMCRFETLGIGSFSSSQKNLFDTEQNTLIPAVSETGVFVLGQYPEQMNRTVERQPPDKPSGTCKKLRWLSRHAIERIERTMDNAGKNLLRAASSASGVMEKMADKTSHSLKKAGDSIKDLLGRNNRFSGLPTTDKDRRNGETAFRDHWKSRYLSSGISFDDCLPAYRYGALLAANGKRNASCTWDEVEPVAHAGWERHYQDRSWETKRDAVCFGWNHVMNGH